MFQLLAHPNLVTNSQYFNKQYITLHMYFHQNKTKPLSFSEMLLSGPVLLITNK